MTAWRVGIAIKPEKKFGVEDPDETWHYVGIGMDFMFTENNGWKFQNGMGSKTPQLEFEGRFSGTWNGNLYFDYNNLYWLQFALEGYAFGTETNPDTNKLIGTHIFHTSNKKALKSFSMRILKLDKEVGGPFDENMVFLGCVMASFGPTYEQSSSAVKSSIRGSFVDTVLTAEELPDTIDASVASSRKTVVPVEWGCLQVLNEDGTEWEKIANNEKTGFAFTRTITTVPECGQRIDTAFYEQAIQPIEISAMVYSRNANQWQTRMHTGGVRKDISTETGNNTSRPRKKGLEPIPNIRIASGSFVEGNTRPDYICYADFEDVVVDSWGNSYMANSEITESPKLKAMTGRVIFKTPDATQSLKPQDETESIYNVTYAFNNTVNESAVPNLVMQYPEGETIKLIKYSGTKEGYTLNGWTYNGQTYQPGQEFNLTGNVTFTANWVQNE